ncbi:DUF4350 domain-containing protein [Arthrobacter sp. NicSoilC5]|uniref:DUF4350 domain-containing protein n=1 Tax=Arthrobacter sp. NicSoilC5 TaxID=2831000 RepID=UPI001CC563D9|nr:DUF4350 domain-containing protein [Arthrobacter sp. NicSoilC5]BCW79310.1 hypothetical protein NicSoilC5_13290 [Arthrobacter sp. NicSoilC5]
MSGPAIAGTDPSQGTRQFQEPGPTGRNVPVRTLKKWLRQHRAATAAAAVVAAALALLIGTQLAPKGDRVPLSVHNAGPEGARALGEILGRHGVSVHTPGRFDAALDDLHSSSSPTLLLYDRNGVLDRQQVAGLMAAAGRVVVVTPRLDTLAALDSGIHQAGVVPDASPVLDPGCTQPDAEAAGQVTGHKGFVYDGGTTCYRAAGTAGMLAVSGDGRLAVLGSTAVLGNDKLDELGNAALAVRLLGAAPDLVWYLPSIEDAADNGSGKTLDDLAPGWARFLGPWLLLVAVVAIIWRGRRHGPLVFEPLPVVVKAVETAEGRARLYQDSRAVDQARDNLRAGLLVRLSGKLRPGPGATAEDTIAAAARLLGRDAAGVRALVNERPTTEARLVAWSQALEKLEKEVMTR